MKKIEYIWAYISENENGEGLCGWLDQNTKEWLPMIAPDEDRLKSLRPLAELIAKQTKRSIKIIKLGVREDVETINPK